MGIGWLVMLVFWGLIAAVAVLGVRWLLAEGRSAPKTEGGGVALEILMQRYAQGEIDREEFEAKRRDLIA
jgi:putative membrane protein